MRDEAKSQEWRRRQGRQQQQQRLGNILQCTHLGTCFYIGGTWNKGQGAGDFKRTAEGEVGLCSCVSGIASEDLEKQCMLLQTDSNISLSELNLNHKPDVEIIAPFPASIAIF